MESVVQRVDACLGSQGIDVGKQTVEKHVANTDLLQIVKDTSLGKVFNCRPEDAQRHSKRWRSSDLASSQATDSISPLVWSFSVLAS